MERKRSVLASHLYDVVTCEHKIALDARLPRERRAAPDPDLEALLRHGRRLERRVADALGYPEVDPEALGWDGAARETERLMREGVPGIYQGVLIEGRRLAQPDLLERVEGASALGPFRYLPGDVKSALHARSDAALQVAFAGLLLESVQGVAPEHGFLIRGDGVRETFELEALRATLLEVVERVEAIADGVEPTAAYFDRDCTRCRWREECLPRLEDGPDVSVVPGLGRTRVAVLRRLGVRTVADLASADLGALRRRGAPTDGMERARRQAEALRDGRVLPLRAVELPGAARVEIVVRVESDPLDAANSFLFAWGVASAGASTLRRVDVRLALDPDSRAAGLRSLIAAVREVPGEPLFSYGGATLEAIDRLGEAIGVEPAMLGDIEGRIVDLAPSVRRAAVLPVRSYDFDSVAAVVAGEAVGASTPPFLERARIDEVGEARLRERAARDLERLLAIRRWLDRAVPA